MECTTSYWNNGYDSTCAGGYVDFSIPMVVETGIPTEADYPYIAGSYGSTAGFPSTTGICSPSSTITDDTVNATYNRFDEPTHEELKELVSYAPVLALIYADSGFMSYVSGVYSGCPDNNSSVAAINHAVVIIGYDSDGNWIVKNSWGTSWGNDGYGTVSKDNDCALSYQIHELRGNN